jgi:hypothetical protein
MMTLILVAQSEKLQSRARKRYLSHMLSEAIYAKVIMSRSRDMDGKSHFQEAPLSVPKTQKKTRVKMRKVVS